VPLWFCLALWTLPSNLIDSMQSRNVGKPHLRRPNILAPYDLGRDRLKDRPSLVWLKLISLAETSSVARESL
jgi:hypothetical protein